jgi:hypothetical protein
VTTLAAFEQISSRYKGISGNNSAAELTGPNSVAELALVPSEEGGKVYYKFK